jgi:hypothetical protein
MSIEPVCHMWSQQLIADCGDISWPPCIPDLLTVDSFPVGLPEGWSVWDISCEHHWLKTVKLAVFWSHP